MQRHRRSIVIMTGKAANAEGRKQVCPLKEISDGISRNPFIEELVREYPSHTPEQVEQALVAAYGAFRSDGERE